MILRIWRGWTDPEKAAAFQSFLCGENFVDANGRPSKDFMECRCCGSTAQGKWNS